MPTWFKFYIRSLILVILMLSPSLVFAADSNLELTGEIRYVATEDGLYGIIADDGKKYQPINLPRELRKNGLSVKFSAEIRDDLFTAINWGTTIKIKSIEQINPSLSSPERTAIYVLLKRLEAFNNKDLTLLEKIDLSSKGLTVQQFDDWIGNYSQFTLRYVEIAATDPTTITGSCIYTRELANTMTLHDDNTMTQMLFTLNLGKDGWKLTHATSEKPRYSLSIIKEQAKLKYGTYNLAALWHQK